MLYSKIKKRVGRVYVNLVINPLENLSTESGIGMIRKKESKDKSMVYLTEGQDMINDRVLCSPRMTN
jgi:hypothetical protein